MCGCGRRGKCSSFYLLNLQQELQRLCAKDTEVKVIEVSSGTWAHCAYFNLYRRSKNERTEWKCRGHREDMKASAELSNIQDKRK